MLALALVLVLVPMRAAMAVLVSSRAARRAQLVNLRAPVGRHCSYLCCSAWYSCCLRCWQLFGYELHRGRGTE